MEQIPDNSILVTMDVRYLYTNIPRKKGIEAVETNLKIKNIQELSRYFSTLF